MDVLIPPGPGVPHGLLVPGSLLIERFSRSPGPGGQSVNATDSRVEVELPLVALDTLLTAAQRQRLRRAYPGDDQRLVAAAREHRSQHRNRVAARERLADQLRAALALPPPTRRATKPTKGSTERRLQSKRERSQTKAARTRPSVDS